MNGERKAKYKRLLNMKISGEAIERLEEEGFGDRFVDGLSIRKYAEAHQLNRGSVDYQQKEILLCSGLSAERAGRGGGNMPAAETSTKVNNQPQTERLRQSRRSVFLSNVCQWDVISPIQVERQLGHHPNIMSNLCHTQMFAAKEVEGVLRRRWST